MPIDSGIWFCTQSNIPQQQEEMLPDKVNINGAHGASEDYPVPPLGVVNGLVDDRKCDWKIKYKNVYFSHQASTINYLIGIWDF